jgi:hypothetical protein
MKNSRNLKAKPSHTKESQRFSRQTAISLMLTWNSSAEFAAGKVKTVVRDLLLTKATSLC